MQKTYGRMCMSVLTRIEESISSIRRVFEASDFGAEFTPELREAEERMRDHLEKHSRPIGGAG